MKLKLLQTWNHEFASPTGALASLCHCVLSQKYIFKRNFSGYHTTGENASVTAAINMIEVNEVNAWPNSLLN